jgi:hypothetical protein
MYFHVTLVLLSCVTKFHLRNEKNIIAVAFCFDVVNRWAIISLRGGHTSHSALRTNNQLETIKIAKHPGSAISFCRQQLSENSVSQFSESQNSQNKQVLGTPPFPFPSLPFPSWCTEPSIHKLYAFESVPITSIYMCYTLTLIFWH